jgi:hypothetical protein
MLREGVIVRFLIYVCDRRGIRSVSADDFPGAGGEARKGQVGARPCRTVDMKRHWCINACLHNSAVLPARPETEREKNSLVTRMAACLSELELQKEIAPAWDGSTKTEKLTNEQWMVQIQRVDAAEADSVDSLLKEVDVTLEQKSIAGGTVYIVEPETNAFFLMLWCGEVGYARPFFPPQVRKERVPGALVLVEWPRHVQLSGLGH